MKKFFAIMLFTVFLPALAAAEDGPARYYIPAEQFNTEFEVMDLGFSNVFGYFRNATGSFEFDGKEKVISEIKIAIDATSLSAANLDNERVFAGLFGAMEFPEIVFTARDAVTFADDNKADIKGTLTLHGVTKPFTLEAVLNHVGKSPHGGGMWSEEGQAMGLSLHGTFKRADFSMTDDPGLPPRFGDEVTLRLETQAIKQ